MISLKKPWLKDFIETSPLNQLVSTPKKVQLTDFFNYSDPLLPMVLD